MEPRALQPEPADRNQLPNSYVQPNPEGNTPRPNQPVQTPPTVSASMSPELVPPSGFSPQNPIKNDESETSVLKSALVGLGLGVAQSIVAILFIPHTLEQRLNYLFNTTGLLIRYGIVIIVFVIVIGLMLKFWLKLVHPFRNALYVPILAQSVSVISVYKSSTPVFFMVTALSFIGGQLLWTYVAKANKIAQSGFVVIVVALAIYSIFVLNTAV